MAPGTVAGAGGPAGELSRGWPACRETHDRGGPSSARSEVAAVHHGCTTVRPRSHGLLPLLPRSLSRFLGPLALTSTAAPRGASSVTAMGEHQHRAVPA